MAKSNGRPSWFKLFLSNKSMIDAIPDEAVGKALKAAFQYFDTGEIPELDPMANIAFSGFKPSVDESFIDYAKNVENGKKGGRPPKDGKPPVTPPKDGLPNQTEAEADTEADTDIDTKKDTEKKSVKADKPPRTRFIPPKVEEVRTYCMERGNSVDPERFVDYYTSNGWMAGRNKMRDWKAAVRTWENNGFNTKRTEVSNGRTEEDRNAGYTWDLSKESVY